MKVDHKTGLPEEDALPESIRRFNSNVVWVMAWVNGFAHLVLGLALAAAVFLFTYLFLDDVVTAFFGSHNLASGFLHGLGSLMLLWTVSALITAELRYLHGVPLTVDTFVEVAIVVILRKLITMPVQSTLPSPQEFILWVGSAVLLGVMYLIVRFTLTIKHPTE